MIKKTLAAALIAAPALFSACNGGTPSASLKSETDTLSYALGVSQSPDENQLKDYLTQNGVDSTLVDEFLKGLKDGLESGDDKQKQAYNLGLQAGTNFKKGMFANLEKHIFGNDSTQHLSTSNFLAGFFDQIKNKVNVKRGDSLLTRQSAGAYLDLTIPKLASQVAEKLHGDNRKAGEAFLAKKAKEAGVQKLEGGVLYKELKAGTGATPKGSDVVVVEYEGRLVDGTVFDSSKPSREGKAEFPVNGVIKGWTTALTHMKVGSEWEVYIPQDQAYGSQDQGDIKPFSALIFKVKLVGVKERSNAPGAPDLVMPKQ